MRMLRFATSVVLTSIISLPAVAEPPSLAEILPPPEGVFCNILDADESHDYGVVWSSLDGAKKYSVELDCTVQSMPEEGEEATVFGNIEVETNIKAGECEVDPETGAGTCGATFSNEDVIAAVNAAIESEELVIPEGVSAGLSCSANVKGLNPPKGPQNHPKGMSDGACQAVQASVCPLWTPEELAYFYDPRWTFTLEQEGAITLKAAIAGSEWIIARVTATTSGTYLGSFELDVDDIKLTRQILNMEEEDYNICLEQLLEITLE